MLSRRVLWRLDECWSKAKSREARVERLETSQASRILSRMTYYTEHSGSPECADLPPTISPYPVQDA